MKKNIVKMTLPLVCVFTLTILSCEKSSVSPKSGDTNTIIDSRDGQEYKTVVIGSQTWMAENLNFDAGEGSYCYSDIVENCDTYGRLYEWEVLIDGELRGSPLFPSGIQGLCPDGWHVPSSAEWDTLTEFIRSEQLDVEISSSTFGDSYYYIGKYLKAPTSWGEQSGSGTPIDIGEDTYGFSALAGGKKDAWYGFKGTGALAMWWTSDRVYLKHEAQFRSLNKDNDTYTFGAESALSALSCRCVKD